MTPVVRGCIAIADQWLEAALFGQLGKAVLAALALAVTIMMALRYAEPIGDGDLFWHMAYARQMIEHGSLKLDHTLYSWTPASNAMIYCAWLSELVLYGLWQFTGPAGIFALRYAIVASVLFLIWRFARQHNVAKTPVLFLCLVLAVELIANGVLPKPEMLSLLAFTATVFVYATFRTASDLARAAVWLYFIPAILLIWVNSHGGFMLISLFLAAIAAGEIGLYGLGADERLPIRALWHLLAAWVLCAVAILLTPYGIKYPVALFREYVLGSVARP